MRVKLRIDLYGIIALGLLIAGILLKRDLYVVASALFAISERLLVLRQE